MFVANNTPSLPPRSQVEAFFPGRAGHQHFFPAPSYLLLKPSPRWVWSKDGGPIIQFIEWRLPWAQFHWWSLPSLWGRGSTSDTQKGFTLVLPPPLTAQVLTVSLKDKSAILLIPRYKALAQRNFTWKEKQAVKTTVSHFFPKDLTSFATKHGEDQGSGQSISRTVKIAVKGKWDKFMKLKKTQLQARKFMRTNQGIRQLKGTLLGS